MHRLWNLYQIFHNISFITIIDTIKNSVKSALFYARIFCPSVKHENIMIFQVLVCTHLLSYILYRATQQEELVKFSPKITNFPLNGKLTLVMSYNCITPDWGTTSDQSMCVTYKAFFIWQPTIMLSQTTLALTRPREKDAIRRQDMFHFQMKICLGLTKIRSLAP